ncbi:MAG: hypothetical protein HWD59_05055 [Coxiellaceae bacterium]|nr:MAG: hypothetical protein HWD59_05055 [Coxiellaceae bacterium]
MGEPQYYNWAEIQTKGQFSLKGAHGLLMDKALAYADQEELKTNYINLVIPDEKTFTTGHDRTTTSTERNRSQAAAVYYQCQQINPNHKIGVEKRSDFSIIVNDKT